MGAVINGTLPLRSILANTHTLKLSVSEEAPTGGQGFCCSFEQLLFCSKRLSAEQPK
jgi:hypothetical protein